MAEPENPAVPAMEKNTPEAEATQSESEVKHGDSPPAGVEQQPTTNAESKTTAEANVMSSVTRGEATCSEKPEEGTVTGVSKSEPLAEARIDRESHGSDVEPSKPADQNASSEKESASSCTPPDVQPSISDQSSVVSTESPPAERREATATADEKKELTDTTVERDSDKSTGERVPESIEDKISEAKQPQETPTVLALTGDTPERVPHLPEAKTSPEKSVVEESIPAESQKMEEKNIEPEPVKETSTTDHIGGPIDISQPLTNEPPPKEPKDTAKAVTDTEKALCTKEDEDQKTVQPTESDNSSLTETPLPQVQRPPSPSQSSKLDQPTATSSELTGKRDIEMTETASQPSLIAHVRKSLSAPDILTRADKNPGGPFQSVVASAKEEKDSVGTQEEKREFQSVSQSEAAPFRGLQQESQTPEESRASFMIWDENSMDVPQSEGSGGFTFGDENSLDLMATNENSTDLIPDDNSMDNIPSTNENSMDIDQARANLESKAAALIDERSQSSTKSSSRRRRGSPVASAQPEKEKEFTAQQLFEYQWPQEKNAEWFMLQEQISEYLGILSFKRKYPDLQRRAVFPNERVFLREKGIVTEMQCDLGLTALKVDEVCDLLAKDYPDKYKTYIEILREREKQRIKDQHKDYDQPKLEKSKMNAYIKKAVKAAAEFNSQFNRERREERRAYFDLQTMEIHYPVHTLRRLPPEDTKVSAYPVALIPGQFQDFYKMYTPQELKYFPLNTAMYSPPRSQKDIYADPNACTDDDEEEVGKAANAMETEDDGSSSSSDSSEESSDDSDKEVEETPTTEPDTDTASQKSERSTPKSRGSRTPASRTPKSASMKNLAREVFSKVIGSSSAKTTASGKLIGRPPGSRGTKRKSLKGASGYLGVTGDVIPKCALCKGTANKNKLREPEELITCSECGSNGHPSCLDLTKEMVAIIKTYNWQCMECKTCSKCLDSGHEDRMMFCDRCDRGCHTFCLGLTDIPTGRWECPTCLLSAETVAKAAASMAAASTDSASMATSTEDKPPDPKKAKTE